MSNNKRIIRPGESVDTMQTLKTIDKILKRAEKVERRGNFKLGAEYRAAAIDLQRRLIRINKERYANN